MRKPETFADLCKQAESAASGLGLFLDREAPARPGWKHVGWCCPDCGQLLQMCNANGHRSAGYSGPSECAVPGGELAPMYVEEFYA